MVRQIAPVFFTMDIPATLAYYTGKLGFACLGTWQDPPVYAIVARDQQVIHFRCAEPPTANPDKYADELLDARHRFSFSRHSPLATRHCSSRSMAVYWLSARTCSLLLVIPNPVACLWRTAVRDLLCGF